MTRQIRRLAVVLGLLFAALFVNLNVLQLVQAEQLANDPNNRRVLIAQYEAERGPILAADQSVLAESVLTTNELPFERRYSGGDAAGARLWSHVTGYFSSVLARSGLEQALNEELTGTPTELLAQNLAELFGAADRPGDSVRITIDPAVQSAADVALGDRIGAVVALDPRTGAVLAHVSHPQYDPNPLSTTSRDAIPTMLDTWDQLRTDPTRPLVDRVRQELYPPGSTYKLLVTAAALEDGMVVPTTAFPDEAQFQAADGQPVRNYQDGPCADGEAISLTDALAVSCNAVFARLGVELGADRLRSISEAFGFNRTPPYELPTVESVYPRVFPTTGGEPSPALVAQSAIGQFDVRATPLQMAMVVQAIVNDGVLLQPTVVQEVRDPSGRIVRSPQTRPWTEGRFAAEAVSPRTAQLLQELMVEAVSGRRATGGAAAISGVRVGGKTGTAQVPDQTPTAWFVGFAEDRVAVAVVVPDAGGDGGGAVAAPIARAVFEAVLRR
ncbi:MAG: peptidoglycan D,D-transpeptidase FtsI family protein [Actinomycetes bacterium]